MTRIKIGWRRTSILLGFALLLVPASGWGATLVRDYELNGSFADALGGSDIISDGGTLNPTNYSFLANQGLHAVNAGDAHDYSSTDYSIESVFSFHDLGGFRKIVDFKDRASDNGLYDLSTALDFFGGATGSAGAFASDVFARVILTRDGTTVRGFVNGVPQFSFTDGGSLAVFDAASNIMRFFEDDFHTGQRESSAGVVDLVRIYNGALTPDEVRLLDGPSAAVPAPATFVLAASGVGALALRAWRQRRRS